MKHVSEYITIVIEELEVKVKSHLNNNGHVLEFKREQAIKKMKALDFSNSGV